MFFHIQKNSLLQFLSGRHVSLKHFILALTPCFCRVIFICRFHVCQINRWWRFPAAPDVFHCPPSSMGLRGAGPQVSLQALCTPRPAPPSPAPLRCGHSPSGPGALELLPRLLGRWGSCCSRGALWSPSRRPMTAPRGALVSPPGSSRALRGFPTCEAAAAVGTRAAQAAAPPETR